MTSTARIVQFFGFTVNRECVCIPVVHETGQEFAVRGAIVGYRSNAPPEVVELFHTYIMSRPGPRRARVFCRTNTLPQCRENGRQPRDRDGSDRMTYTLLPRLGIELTVREATCKGGAKLLHPRE